MWALIIDGEVRDVTSIDPDGRFHPSITWVKCPADTQTGYLYDGLSFNPPESVN